MGCQCWYPKLRLEPQTHPSRSPQKLPAFAFQFSAQVQEETTQEKLHVVSPLHPLLAFSLLTSSLAKKADITQELTGPRCNLQPHAGSPGASSTSHLPATPPVNSQLRLPSKRFPAANTISTLPHAAPAPPCSGSGGLMTLSNVLIN